MVDLTNIIEKSNEFEYYNNMVLELLDCKELNSWEYDFINNVSDNEFCYSQRQKEKIYDIYINYL